MTLPIIFATAAPPLHAEWLDTDFAAIGALATIPCTIAGTNTLTFTALANTPLITSYSNYLRIAGIAANTNTGATTAAAFGLPALSVFKDTGAGPAALTGSEIIQNNQITLVFDQALASGAGGWHIEQLPGTQPAGAAGGDLGSTYPNPTVVATHLSAALPIAQGGTASSSAIGARANLGVAAYATGTWTPTLLGSTAAGSPTYVSQVGSYEQIGRLVVARFTVQVSALGGPTGNMQIGGLPFTSANVAGDLGMCSISAFTGVTLDTGFAILAGLVQPNTTVIQLWESATTKTAQQTPVADFAAATTLQGIVTYRSS